MSTESPFLDSSRVWAERMLQQLEDQDEASESRRILEDNVLEYSNLSNASIGSQNATTIVPPFAKTQTEQLTSPASVHSESTLEYGSPVNILSSSFSFCLSESQLSSVSDIVPLTFHQDSRKLNIAEIPVSNQSSPTSHEAKLDLDQQLQEIESKKKALQAKTASDFPLFSIKDSQQLSSLQFRTVKHLAKSMIASPNISLTSQLPLKKNHQRTTPTNVWTHEKENQILQELPKSIPLSPSATERSIHVFKINDMLKESGFALLIPQKPSEGKSKSNISYSTENFLVILEQILLQYADRSKLMQDIIYCKSDRSEVNSLQEENKSLKKFLEDAEKRIQSLQEGQATENVSKGEEISLLKSANENLKMKLSQLHEKYKLKVKEYDMVRAKLAEIASQEEKRMQKDRQVFTDIVKRPIKAHDSKTLDIISMYEKKTGEMEKELIFLKKQVRDLSAKLYINNQPTGRALLSDNVMKIQNLESQLVALQHELDKEKIENEKLKFDLDSRPTPAQWKDLKKKLADSEKNLYHLMINAKDTSKKRVQGLSDSALSVIVQDVCRELNATDLSLILPSIQKMKQLVGIVPSMEKFVTDICKLIHGYLEPGQPEPRITQVPQVLHSSFQQLRDLKDFKQKLCKIIPVQDQEASLEDLLEQAELALKSTPLLPSGTDDAISQIAAEVLGIHPSQLAEECKSLKEENDHLRERVVPVFSRLLNRICEVLVIDSLDGILPAIEGLKAAVITA